MPSAAPAALVLLLAASAAAQSADEPAPPASARELRLARAAHARTESLAEKARDGDEKSFRALLADLAAPGFEARIRALGGLDRAGNRAAIPHIVPLLDDPSPFVHGWGKVSYAAMWDLETLTREYEKPALHRALLARACSAVWRRTEPGRAWDACARWTSPSFAPPPAGLSAEKSLAYWKRWWRAHRAAYEGMSFEQGRRP